MPAPDDSMFHPTSAEQRSFYTLQSLRRQSTSYNCPLVFEVAGQLDRGRLESAFRELIRRHEGFRTGFELIEGEVFQRVHPEAALDFEYSDFSKEGELEFIGRVIRPFDLAAPPLLRVGIFVRADATWVLALDVHHVVFDANSLAVLFEDLAAFYRGEVLEPLPWQYKDYVAWLRGDEQQKRLQAQADFWLRQFENGAPVLNLPTDYRRPREQTSEGGLVTVELPAEKLEAIQSFARRERVTPFLFFLAVGNVLLHKLTGETDLLIGSVADRRGRAELRNLIGIFVNTVVYRNAIDPSASFRAFLKEVRNGAFLANDNREYPFADLVAKVAPGRDASRNPLFDVMVIHERMQEDFRFPDLQFREYVGDAWHRSAKFDFSLVCIEKPGRLILSMEYARKLFRETTIKRYLGYVQSIIDQVLRDPTVEIGRMEILPPDERELVLSSIGKGAQIPGDGRSIPEVFEATARRLGERRAVSHGCRSLTFAELERESARMAAGLRGQGVGAGAVVAVLLRKSPEVLVAMLGALRAGGAFLLLDPDHPPERLRFLVEDSGAEVLVTASGLSCGDFSVPVLRMDDMPPGPVAPMGASAAAGDAAYVIYTSGSTGRPKGVLVEHRSVLNTIDGLARRVDFQEEEVLLQIPPLSFDAALEQIFLSLLRGGELVLVERDELLDRRRLLGIIEERGVTHIHSVPAFLAQLELPARNAVRRILSGGDVLSAPVAARFVGRYRTFNKFGPAENTITSTIHEIRPEDLEAERIPIGRPIDNSEVLVLGRNGELVPIGVAGEIHVAGAGLARGYVGHAGGAPNGFGSHPFREGERIYSTGDSGKWTEEGDLIFLGRGDSQVKIRGHRIELSEIAGVLCRLPQCTNACAVEGVDPSGEKCVWAYVEGPATLTKAAVRGWLQDILPDYMMPAGIAVLERFPYSEHRKIDRSALPPPEPSEGEEKAGPAGELEEKLILLWSRVLGLPPDRIGADDDFFALGGHSLKAGVLMDAIASELGLALPWNALFVHSTVRKMAAHLARLSAEDSDIPRAEPRPHYRASPAQRRLHALQQVSPESAFYNIPSFYRIDGPVDVERLREVFRKLVDRHEALRTSFHLREDECVQVVESEVEPSFEASEVCEGDLERKLAGMVRPFDLEKAPLLRAGVVRVKGSPDYTVLMIDVHHIVFDEGSHDILFRDVTELYAGLEISPLELQFKDYAEWLESEVNRDRKAIEEQYWKKQFATPPPDLELPADFRRPAAPTFRGEALKLELGAAEGDLLERLARDCGVTKHTLWLGLTTVFLAKVGGVEDVVVGTPVNERPSSKLSRCIGFFVNTIPLRTRLDLGKTFVEYLRRLRETVIESLTHGGFPFERIVEQVCATRDIRRNPVFDVLFAYHRKEAHPTGLPNGLQMTKLDVAEQEISKFDLSIICTERDDGVTITFEFATDLFEKETIARLAESFGHLVRSVSRAPDQALADSLLLSEDQRSQLETWSQGVASECKWSSLVEMFEERVRACPDAIAIAGDRGQWTYRAVNGRANRIADYLRRNWGVRPEARVAVCMPRSMDLVASILGILKAGGAYVPVDPDDPSERSGAMIEDSGAVGVLASREAGAKWPDVPSISPEDVPFDEAAEVDPPRLVRPENAAYVIYTSGSSGTPKGVVVEHRNVLNTLGQLEAAYPLGENDAILLKTPCTFDVSVAELFGWFSGGGKLVLSDSGDEKDPGALARLIGRHEVTHVNFVPSLFTAFVAALEDNPSARLDSVKYWLVAGEVFPKSLAQACRHLPGACVNLYGPTEAAVYHTMHSVVDEPGEAVPIGRPFRNTQAHVLDRFFQPVGVGLKRELFLGGAGLARGYLGRPALTAECFLPSPWDGGRRIYRSGDVASWSPAGHLICFGRRDSQIKLRGVRIELEEIENVLRQCPGIREVAVGFFEEEGPDSAFLGAFYTGGETTVEQLREFAVRKLPKQAVPTSFAWLAEMPRTSSGKLNRRALPRPQFFSRSDSRRPLEGCEIGLAEIWVSVLGVEQAGADDDFFELGGHSLRVIRLSAEVERRFGVRLGARFFFENTTLGLQARAVEESIRSREMLRGAALESSHVDFAL